MTEQTATDAWTIPVEDFPANALAKERLLFALRFAILAPSGTTPSPGAFTWRATWSRSRRTGCGLCRWSTPQVAMW